MNVSFPLRDGYFRPLQYTPQDEARWKQFMIDLVATGLREEREYAEAQYSIVNTAQWKLLREKEQLRVYRPRSSSSSPAAARGAQSVLAVGTIEGTLEDVIHGVHHVTTQDMRVTTSFLSADALDSAVLHVFENGTDEDPFRSFAVKWRIIETPAGGLVKNRDGVVLEYLGIDVDANGERFAFHITETFDHPVCPPFHPQCAIRAKAHIRIIYRQVSPGRVGVYFLGDYALSGRLPGVIARLSTAEIAVSIGKSVECTEAKKLTALALTSSPVLNQQTLRGGGNASRTSKCTICTATPGRLTTRTIALCHLCGVSVCSKCRSQKHLLSDESKIPVVCCKKCIVVAKQLVLDPSQPLRLVSAARWRSQNTLQGDELLWERECRTVEEQSLSSRSRRVCSSDGSWSSSISISGVDSARKRSMETDGIGSDLTITSTLASSRSVSSLDLSYLDDVAGHVKRSTASAATSPVVSPPSDQTLLWRQMQELRLTAEQTYQLTKHTHQLIVDGKPPQRYGAREAA